MVAFVIRIAAAAVVTACSVMAQLQQVNSFGDTFNTQLTMEIYVPPNPAPSPAIVLAASHLTPDTVPTLLTGPISFILVVALAVATLGRHLGRMCQLLTPSERF
jgi:hypothetical protein